jgi:hypothetical protein
VDLPGAEDLRGQVVFEVLGPLLLQRSAIPDPNVPDTICVVVPESTGQYRQHYFDSRGVARLYEMTFDGMTWTLLRNKPDSSPLDFHQRYVGRLSDDQSTIEGEWQRSDDGRAWSRDFGLEYRRIA